MRETIVYVHGKGGPAGRLTARTGGERSLALGERSGAGRGETVAAARAGAFCRAFSLGGLAGCGGVEESGTGGQRWANGVISCPGGSEGPDGRRGGGRRFFLRFFGGAAKMGAKSRRLAASAREKPGKREGDR